MASFFSFSTLLVSKIDITSGLSSDLFSPQHAIERKQEEKKDLTKILTMLCCLCCLYVTKHRYHRSVTAVHVFICIIVLAVRLNRSRESLFLSQSMEKPTSSTQLFYVPPCVSCSSCHLNKTYL